MKHIIISEDDIYVPSIKYSYEVAENRFGADAGTFVAQMAMSFGSMDWFPGFLGMGACSC